MTPASERAREIEREEFEAERIAVRARAIAYSRQCREREAEEFRAWMNDRPSGAGVRYRSVLARHHQEGSTKCSCATAANANLYSARGKKLTSREWAEEIGIPHQVLRGRLSHGWSIERALSEPVTTQGQRAQRSRNAKVIHKMIIAFNASIRAGTAMKHPEQSQC